MFFFFLSCKDTSVYNLRNNDFLEEHPSLTPIDTSLSKPTQMTHYEDGNWIIDEESFLVHHYDESQQPIETYTFSEAPKHIVSQDNMLLMVATDTEVFQFQSGDWISIATETENISHIAIYKNNPAYVVNREMRASFPSMNNF